MDSDPESTTPSSPRALAPTPLVALCVVASRFAALVGRRFGVGGS